MNKLTVNKPSVPTLKSFKLVFFRFSNSQLDVKSVMMSPTLSRSSRLSIQTRPSYLTKMSLLACRPTRTFRPLQTDWCINSSLWFGGLLSHCLFIKTLLKQFSWGLKHILHIIYCISMNCQLTVTLAWDLSYYLTCPDKVKHFLPSKIISIHLLMMFMLAKKVTFIQVI